LFVLIMVGITNDDLIICLFIVLYLSDVKKIFKKLIHSIAAISVWECYVKGMKLSVTAN